MTKEFNVLAFIGRFSPLHNGHCAVIDQALLKAKEVVILVGSADEPRNIRNPFTFLERRNIIKANYPEDAVIVKPLLDYPYNNDKWLSAVQNIVIGAMKHTNDPWNIGLIGHNKDHSSYYLDMFGDTWGSVSVDNFDGINSTDIRTRLLADDYVTDIDSFKNVMPLPAQILLSSIIKTIGTDWDTLVEEYRYIKAEKTKWDNSPYPPIFHTTDAVVTQSGHILLVKRKGPVGKDLWALPGGFLEQHETLLDGMIRELREETKIKVPEKVLKGSIKEHKVFDSPYRSCLGRVITTAYHMPLDGGHKLPKIIGSDDVYDAKWVLFKDVRRNNMHDDHYHIIDHFIRLAN